MNDKWFYTYTIGYAVCTCLIISTFMLHLWSHNADVLVVDVQSILKTFIEANTKEILDTREANNRTDKFTAKLSETINQYAKPGVVIVSKNAVLAGGLNITSKIKATLFENREDI